MDIIKKTKNHQSPGTKSPIGDLVPKKPQKKRLVLGFRKWFSTPSPVLGESLPAGRQGLGRGKEKPSLSPSTSTSPPEGEIGGNKKRKLIFSLALILLIIAPISFYLWNKQAGASWWNSDWNYRRSITINSAQIPGDLNNFPMLVSFTDSNLINKTQSNGNDIIFIEENGTRLNHEIEKFDNTTGELVAWVKIPQLDGDNDSIIYMYYGNQTVDNQQRPEDVWDENYISVQHFNESSTTLSSDSTRNNKNGTKSGFEGDELTSSGKVGPAYNLDGTNDYIFTPDMRASDYDEITMSVWFKSDVDNHDEEMLIWGQGHPNSGTNWAAMFHRADTDQYVWYVPNTGWADTETENMNWNYATMKLSSNNQWEFGFNGNSIGTYNDAANHANRDVSNFVVAGNGYWGYLDGLIDEVRISKVPRSNDWITTEYNNQNSPATFISLGQEERGPSPALYLPFDEGFGTTAHDETSNRNDGTIVGATWKDESMCKSGKCLEFDGTGDYVEIADNQSLDLSEEVTLEAWVKPTSTTPQNQTIISKEEKPVDPTKIYRSVGPSTTTAIAVGTSNAMNITGDRATFATALPDNVGVGDVIQYDDDDDGDIDSSDSLAFVTGRISNTQYTISNASGGAPNPVNADNNWSLFRAYTSLANAESGIENTGIDSDLRNFDDWTAGGDATTDDAGKDLVVANQQWNIACYANGTTADTINVIIDGWTTGVNSFLKIYTPVSSNEVGITQRHNGRWDNNKYKIEDANSTEYTIRDFEEYIWFEGLQIFSSRVNYQKSGINVSNTVSANSNIKISNNILKASFTGTGNSSTHGGISLTVSDNVKVFVWNNTIYNWNRADTTLSGIVESYGNSILFNNTIYNTYYGIYKTQTGDSFIKNNIIQNNNSGIVGTFNSSSTNNLTSNTPSATNAFGATYTTGTTDGTTASKLINSTETFIAKGVQIGSIIKNTTDSTYTYVTALDSETQLSIANDIFVSGENYSIYKNKYGNVSFVSTTAGSEDFHLSPTDTVAKNSGADLSGDSVFPFNSDIDGQQRLDPQEGGTTAWDIGADEARATQIYRSVAPNKTDALEDGEDNSMTIVGNIATFQRALADNVGVGDVIQYDDDNDGDIDANDSLAFIVERITNYEYRITNASGGTPVPVNSDTNWSLFRAYTSLANAENGTENTGIDSDLRNFDTWMGGKDLVTSKEQWNIACYANGTTPDTTAVVVDGWITGVQNFVKIYTPVSGSEVGVSQRHSGKWDEGRYKLIAFEPLKVFENYSRIIGLQVGDDTTSTYSSGAIRSIYENNKYQLYDSLIIRKYTGSNLAYSAFWIADIPTGTVLRNSVIYDFNGGTYGAIVADSDDGTNFLTIQNVTIYNSEMGIHIYEGSYTKLKNVLSYDNSIADFNINGNTWHPDSNYNLSSDGTAPGANSKINQTVAFVDATNRDLHLAPTDTAARNAGKNLSDDPYFPFETDIDGDKRLDLQGGGTTSWDIGADEAVATKIYRSVGPGNTSALATDEAHDNSVVVSSGVASFSANIPDKVGVGDAVLIDTNSDNSITSADTLLFISKRNSATSYQLQANNGSVPGDISSNDTYQIFRAYTSLANAESGTKNTSIPISFNGGNRDLVANNEEWNIACYGDGVDTGLQVSGWTTGVENYMKIFTPQNSNEVGITQRHNGKWNNNKYQIVSDTGHIFDVRDAYLSIDGVQMAITSSSTGYPDVITYIPDDGAVGNIFYLSNSIMEQRTISGEIQSRGVQFNNTNGKMVAWNNISYGWKPVSGASGAYAIFVVNGDAYIYNNVMYDNYTGLRITAGSLVKNNASFGNVDDFFNVNTSNGFNNASDDGDGINPVVPTDWNTVFQDVANKDFRLKTTDISLRGRGLNLSNDTNLPITQDIEGEKRPSLRQGSGLAMPSSLATNYNLQPTSYSWDIGADQISNTVHNNYSLNLKTDYPQANFSTGDNDQDNFSSGDINLAPNQWSHLVYKRSNNTEELYLNGSKKDSKSISNFLKTNNGKLYLGSKDTNSKNSFKGFLDEVRIYPYARTEDEIKKDKTQGSSGRAASRAQEGINVSMGDQASNLSDGLVGYWKMDESSWTGAVNEVKDASGNNNHGTANGGATTTGGKFGSGGGFDGVDDWVTVPDSEPISITNAYTYAAWVRFDSDTSLLDSLISKKSQIGITRTFLIARTSAGGGVVGGKVRLAVTHNGTENYTSWDYPYQEWFHLAVRWDGLNIYIYKNGILLNQFAASGLLETTDYPLIIGDGDNNFSWDGIFDGAQDDIRLYNRALSEDEIKQLYNYAPGPVLHLKMDEKSGTTAYDSSGYNNHGTLTNGPIWENGKINSGINFDGGDDYIDISDDTIDMAGNSFTLSTWYSQDILTGGLQRIITSPGNEISGEENFSIYINGSNTCFLKRGPASDDYICTPSIDVGVWHHISGVYDGQEMRIYIDGILKNQKYSVVSIINSNDDLQIGRYGPTWGQYFDGSIDDVKIYNYARTQEQILEDMGSQSSSVIGSEGNTLKKPILDLNFNEGQGSTAYDSSGNGNNGVLNAGGSGTNATTTAMWDKGGKFGGAVEFDGTNDSVEATNATSFDSTDNTYSVWIKPSVLGDAKTIMDLDFDEQWLGIHNSQYTIYGRCGQHGYGVPNTTSWQHIVWTVKGGGDYNLYANGERIGTGSGCNASVNADKLTIGSTNNSERFSGLIDEVKFYNYVLSEDEVIALYNDSSAMVMGNDESRDNNGTEVTGANKDYCIPGDTAKCDKPVLELKMDEMTGTTAYDTSGNGNNGTFVNGPVWDIGKIGSGINFNGSDSYLNLGSSSTLNMYNSNYTLQSWVYLRSHDPSYTDDVFARGAYGCGHDFGISAALQPSPNRVYLHHFGAGAPESDFGNTDVSLNAWHHIAVTYDNVSHIATYYLDGKMDGQKTINAMVNCTTRTSYVGVDGRDVIDFVPDGSMDDIRIYNYARTPAQIAWDYNQGKPINHWTFDEGTGSTVHDEGPNLNNGTITGATWKNESECKNGKCLYFDGLDTTRVDADTQDNMSQFTACAWVNPKAWTNTSGDSEMFIFNKGFTLRLLNDGKIDFRHSTSGSYPYRTTNDSIVLDEWSRVCGVYRGVSVSPEVYVNGKNMPGTGEAGNGTADDDSASILRIGSYGNEWYGNFYGYIDDPKIYNYALTDEQIKMDYNDGAVNFK